MNEEKEAIEGVGTLEVLKAGKTKSGKDKYSVKIDDMWANWWQLDEAKRCADANIVGKTVKYFAEKQGNFVNIKSLGIESDYQPQVQEEPVGQPQQSKLPTPSQVSTPTQHNKPDTSTAIKRQVFLKCSVEMLKVNGEGMGIRSAIDVVAYAKQLEQECNKENWL